MPQLKSVTTEPSAQAGYDYGDRTSGDPHGFVLTKPSIANFLLDLVGYTQDKDLSRLTLLEPSCGHGVFLRLAVGRLVESCRKHSIPISNCKNAIVAFDIDRDSINNSKLIVAEELLSRGVDPQTAELLIGTWINTADFLLAAIPKQVDFIVGNPPYIRIEQIPRRLQANYRMRFVTLRDRADLYVAFIEKGLGLLREGGMLSFICANRWTTNRYGSELRKLITQRYNVRAYIDVAEQVRPFESEVAAYPSIFLVSNRDRQGPVVTSTLSNLHEETMNRLVAAIDDADNNGLPLEKNIEIRPRWFKESEPWSTSINTDEAALLGSIEARFPKIEETGVKIGIGVATGCDSVLIVPESADIESDRLLPLVTRDDIRDGVIQKPRLAVIDTFSPSGLIKLENYPKLKKYLEAHSEKLKSRHVAKKSPHAWFRTIDKIRTGLIHQEKLLIPDIAGKCEVTLDKGTRYPHHNLYYVTSDVWDLELLAAILTSSIGNLFVRYYSVKMRGGYLRFQAQNLRRIRLPEPESITKSHAEAAKIAFRMKNPDALDRVIFSIYGIDRKIPLVRKHFIQTHAKNVQNLNI